MTRRFILASASPRRRELLRNAGYTFEVVPAHVDENHEGTEAPTALAERLALAKAEIVAKRLRQEENAVVLGADTIVVLDDHILGKPASPADARRTLERLSGRAHEVITGVALVAPAGIRHALAHATTRVLFRVVPGEEIEHYLATGEPMDKAGAYAIQGYAGRFVERLEGCYFNVMGLPVALVDRMLREWESGGSSR